jgi:hypothetical protein
MKKVIFTNVMLLLLSFTTMAQDRKVAVFDPSGSISSSVREIVREEMSSIVVNALGYTVLERSLIDKVLEENRFQTGGLVDDSQISEIGKRMGANLVLISSITMMEDGNYYLSCKLIDVLTARVEKQKTGRTARGSSDLIDVVGQIMSEMFLNTTRVADTPRQDDPFKKDGKSKQNEKPSPIPPRQTPPPQNNTEIYLYSCGVEVMTYDLSEKYTWTDAMQACPNGWRLPTSQELDCICESKNMLPGLIGKQYWSSSTHRKKRDVAISRTLNDCKEENEDMKEKYSCRCVRDLY